MRGIAVMLVIGAHMGVFNIVRSWLSRHLLSWIREVIEIDLGDFGVSIFFVISGFLITTLILKGKEGTGRNMLPDFYLRRFFRIFPPYYLYLGVIAGLWALHTVPLSWGNLLAALTYTSDYYPYTSGHPESFGWLVGHTWSLSLEEQFYLLWPACLYFLGSKRSFRVSLAVLAIAPVLRVGTLALRPAYAFDGQIARMFHTRIDTIMFGCVLAMLHENRRTRETLIWLASRNWLTGVAGVLLFLDLQLIARNLWAGLLFGYTLQGALLAFFLLHFTILPSSPGGKILNHRALVHVGLISYSLYLWQQLFDGPVHVLPWRHGLRLIWMFASAEVSFFFVERQSVKVRDRYLAYRARRQVAAKAA